MIESNKKDFSMNLNRLLLAIMLLHSFANALSLDEILDQDYIEPSFDCDKARYGEFGEYKYEDEYAICGGLMYLRSNSFLALQDNLYASYYQIVMKNIDSTDRDRIKQISLNMIKHRRKCIDETISNTQQDEKEMRKEGYRFNPANFDIGISDCILLDYLEALKQITEFIYNNPKYKGLFEKIFYPNPKEYYDILFTKQLDDRLLTFTEKAAQDNLINKNGKLKNIQKDKSGGI